MSNPDMNNPEMTEEELDRWRSESPAAGRVAFTDGTANPVAKKIRGLASQIKSGDLETEDGQLQRIKNNVSEYLNTAASYVENNGPERIKANIENQVRRNPGRSLLIVGAAGVILGSLLRKRSSSS